jgi:hypothetical protein
MFFNPKCFLHIVLFLYRAGQNFHETSCSFKVAVELKDVLKTLLLEFHVLDLSSDPEYALVWMLRPPESMLTASGNQTESGIN